MYGVRSVCHSSATLSIQRKATVVLVHSWTKRNETVAFSHNIGTMPARYVLVASPLHISNSSPQPPPGWWISLLPLAPSTLRLSTRLSPSHFIRMIVPFHGDDPPLNGAYIPATLHHPLGTHIHEDGV